MVDAGANRIGALNRVIITNELVGGEVALSGLSHGIILVYESIHIQI
jgi:hypothetical protein